MMVKRDELFESNLSFFKEIQPPLYERLSEHEPLASLVFDDDDDPDVEFQGMRLYGMGAKRHAELQCKKFWQNPEVVSTAPITSNSVDTEAGQVLYNTLKFAQDNNITFNEKRTTHTAFHLVILGVGLGQHIVSLLEETRARNVIIVEPNFEFLYQSMYVFDWAKELGNVIQDGGKVHLLTEASPQVLILDMRALYTEAGRSCFDGLTVYKHYENSAFDAVINFLVTEGDMLFSGLGFFEDELNMIANTYNNLKSGKEKVFFATTDQKTFPVFVVGSGASLDDSFEVIRKNAHKAIVISCGTALLPLLRNGIKPDFHAELERSKFQMEIPEVVSREFDLSDIWLVGSSTLVPGVKKVFQKRIYFFRHLLSSFPAFSGHLNNCLRFPSPTVGNTGLSFAQDNGFRTIYMFGMDLGFSNSHSHHSADSIYHKKGGGYEVPVIEGGRSARGNFGGSVRTTHVLHWSRDTIEISMKHSSMGYRYFNCSDGAFVEGTVPMLPEFVDLPELDEPKDVYLERLINNYPTYSKADFDSHWQDGQIIKSVREKADKFIQCIRENEDLSTKKYISVLMEMANPHKYDDAATMVLQGTLFQMLIVGEYYLDRIEQEDKKDKLMAYVRDEYCQLLDQLCDIVDDELTALQNTGKLATRETVWE